ncbi:methyltransferase domain-containing protein [Desulfovibrio desulfuricans]|uniref:methyltransferase domain-containing protein n=1 Tax=Desulfovibrio desulfuricans TaxID=876 RepID=UPI0035AED199
MAQANNTHKAQGLSSGDWHNAIVGGQTPETVAQRVHDGVCSRWGQLLLELTKPGEVCLELGSGTGEISSTLALHKRQPVLLDFSVDSLRFSERLFSLLHLEGEFKQADVLGELPCGRASADVVWSGGLLEHFSDGQIQHIVSESARVARRMVVSLVPNACSLPYRLGKWAQEQSGEWKWGYEDPKFSLADFFMRAGLVDVREFSIASGHALKFMTFPGSEKLIPVWENWLASLPAEDKERLNQGYLLVTVGMVPAAGQAAHRAKNGVASAAVASPRATNTNPAHDMENPATACGKALQWVEENTVPGKGVAVSDKNRHAYPEVTGYFIPTLLRLNKIDIALQYAGWLASIQNPDGSFWGPNSSESFVFDTGQVVRGLAAILPYAPHLEQTLVKACNWIVFTANPSGQLCVPPSTIWQMADGRGYINEAVHLYVLPGLLAAGDALNTPAYNEFVRRSLSYYIMNCNLSNFYAPNMLLHFYCYIQEALYDLGAEEVCRHGMLTLEKLQRPDGMVPAFSDVSWVCTPGLIQAAIVWLKLGRQDRGLAALSHVQSLRTASGGFPGSAGQGAAYFQNEELSWAVKFWLDAQLLRQSRHESPSVDVMSQDLTGAERIQVRDKVTVIDLVQNAVKELENTAAQAAQGGKAQLSTEDAEFIASIIPSLLNWGRRPLALQLAAELVRIVEGMPDSTWDGQQKAHGLWGLAALIRAFSQPEVLAVCGDDALKSLCVQVLCRQRLNADGAAGLFSCFAALAEAGERTGNSSWKDCARFWANRQGWTVKSITPDHVRDAASFIALNSPERGNALLQQLARQIDAMGLSGEALPQEYARCLLQLAEAAWNAGCADLGEAAYSQGMAALPETVEAPFAGLAQEACTFLNALTARQKHGFEAYFPNFIDDIAADDGRLLFVQSALAPVPHARVLDMGTAKGRYLRRLHYGRLAASVTGQDVHDAFFRFMPKGVAARTGTVLRSGWADGEFDAVLLCEVLEHCIDVPAAIAEMHRILCPSGQLIIIDKNKSRLDSWPGGIPEWEQWFDCEALAAQLRERGFDIAAMDADVGYEGRKDGLFFGITAKKK